MVGQHRSCTQPTPAPPLIMLMGQTACTSSLLNRLLCPMAMAQTLQRMARVSSHLGGQSVHPRTTTKAVKQYINSWLIKVWLKLIHSLAKCKKLIEIEHVKHIKLTSDLAFFTQNAPAPTRASLLLRACSLVALSSSAVRYPSSIKSSIQPTMRSISCYLL
jgi:hypothetical protein